MGYDECIHDAEIFDLRSLTLMQKSMMIDGGTLSVTEEKKKKDFYSSSIRLG